MPNGMRPNIMPKISASGKVNTFDGKDNVTLDFLMKQPKGFLEPYWPAVTSLKQAIYGDTGSGDEADDDLSDLFSSARRAGRGSVEYNKAVSSIRAKAVSHSGRNTNQNLNQNIVTQLLINEILGMGIVQPIWDDDRVHELYINGPYDIQVEMDDGLHRVPGASFANSDHVKIFIDQVLGEQNKTLDGINVEAESRLSDGSRFTAIDKSIAPAGPNVDIRRHDPREWTLDDLVYTGMASRELLIDLERYIRLGMSTLIIGGTSTGKTTLLGSLTGLLPDGVRIVTIEDDLELKVNPNKLLAAPMESRRPGLNGIGGVSLRYLVASSLRLSPTVLIIGETRAAEAADMINAANTGHQVFSTIHANNTNEAIGRLEGAISQGGELQGTETLSAIKSAFALIIQIKIYRGMGMRTRRVISEVSEVDTRVSRDEAGEPTLKTHPLWQFKIGCSNENGEILGDWVQVGSISQERKEMYNDFDYQKPLQWDQMLALEDLPKEKSMYGHDEGSMWPTASEYMRRMNAMRPGQHAQAPAPGMTRSPSPMQARNTMPPQRTDNPHDTNRTGPSTGTDGNGHPGTAGTPTGMR